MNKRQRLQSALVSTTGRKADLATREQVFRCVASARKARTDAPHTVPGMVSRLAKRGITASAVSVNNHLRALRDLGICEVVGQASAEGRGRPAAIWGLTDSGRELAKLR